MSPYVERRHDSFYLVGSRIPLSCLVYLYKQGELPESIRADYPSLTLEQVYGALAFYLGNQEDVEADLREREREEEEFSRTHPMPPELKAKLERARQARAEVAAQAR